MLQWSRVVENIHRADVVVALTASLGSCLGAQILRGQLDEARMIFWEFISKDGP